MKTYVIRRSREFEKDDYWTSHGWHPSQGNAHRMTGRAEVRAELDRAVTLSEGLEVRGVVLLPAGTWRARKAFAAKVLRALASAGQSEAMKTQVELNGKETVKVTTLLDRADALSLEVPF